MAKWENDITRRNATLVRGIPPPFNGRWIGEWRDASGRETP
jgi:hypothetical protein